MRTFTYQEILKIAADADVSATTTKKWNRASGKVYPTIHAALAAAAVQRGFATPDEVTAHAALVLGGGK